MNSEQLPRPDVYRYGEMDRNVMKTGSYSHSARLLAGGLAVLTAFAAYGQGPARGPGNAAEAANRRAEQAQQAWTRAWQQKNEAALWASRRGYPMRYADGPRIFEIMAIQNNRPLIYSTFNENAALSTSAHEVRDTLPFNVNGSGITVGIWDGGVVYKGHQELSNRVVLVDSAMVSSHATHVAGTIGATGVVAEAMGMAPRVRIDSYDWNYDNYEMFSAGSWSPAYPGKIYLSNHSYGIVAGWFYASFLNPYTRTPGYHYWGDIFTEAGGFYFGMYGEGPSEWDKVVNARPYYLPFKAAGNERDDGPAQGETVYYTDDNGDTWKNTVYDAAIHTAGDGIYKNGYDTIPYYGTAKNILTIGAVTDAVVDGLRDPSAAGYTTFTSWGPTDDGRIKPDLVANGHELYSCGSRSTAEYQSRSGTSMSTPNACGSAALLVDYYQLLYPGDAMRASTLKGLLIHTADDLGRPGPDYQYGWGLVNTRKAAEVIQEHYNGNLSVLAETLLTAPTNTVETHFAYADGSEPIRVTLCWTDPPGTPATTHDSRVPVLVNDLDVRVTGPDGTEYYPYRLNYDDPEALAVADGRNDVDNVEQVFIPAPVPGLYIITVEVDGGLNTSGQWYSLIASGMLSDITNPHGNDSDGDGMPDLWETAYFLNTTGGVSSADMDGDGMDNMDEYIAGSDPNDPASVFRIASIDSAEPIEQGLPVITWDSVPGRIYHVYWTHALFFPFVDISDELHWPRSSYTGSVERAGDRGFYKIDVQLAP